MFDIFNICQKIKRILTVKTILLVWGVTFLFFGTRLINLNKFPIFSDEGIYIHWAKVARTDATWRFISLTDGKQPLQTWGTIAFLKLFPHDSLLAGRLFAVATGFVALIGVCTLLYYLFGKKAAFWGSFLYILTPYFLFYDRLALVDSGLNAGFIWIFFLSIVLIRSLRLDAALLFGIISGITMLAKSSAQLFVGLSAFAPILLYEKGGKQFIKKLINYFILYGIGVCIAIVIYNVQRLSPFLHFVAEKNKTFVMTPQEFLHTPFAYFTQNVLNVPLYIVWESGFVLPLLGIVGLFTLVKKNWGLAVYFILWLIIPYGAVSFFSKVLFPRYIIFLPTLFLIPAAYFLSRIDKQKGFLVFLIFLLPALYFNSTIMFDYKSIPFPPVDRGQYIEAWPSGWGAKEIVEYSREKSKEKPVILLAEGSFGMAGDVLDTLLKPGDVISIRGYWPLGLNDLTKNQKDLDKNYVFVVFAHPELFSKNFPEGLPLRLIKKYDKPGGKSALYLYELTK